VRQQDPPVHVCGAGPLIQYAATRPSLQGNVLAAVIGVVLFVLTALTQGACYDSPDPAASYCTSDSIIPSSAARFVWIAFLGLAVYLVYRAVRPSTHR